MKIVFIGYQYPYGNKSFGKSLDVEIFVDSLSEANNRNVDSFYLDEYLDKETSKSLNDDIKKYCSNSNPELIVFNLINNELDKTILSYLKKQYKTLNWFGDDQWRYDIFSKEMAKYFTYQITTDKFSVQKYLNDGYPNVILSQWGGVKVSDVDLNQDIKHLYDVSFIGAYSPVREWVIEYLISNGVNVKCFGFNWPSGPIESHEMIEKFKQTKINLNLSNSVNNDIDFLKYNFVNLLKSFKHLLKLNFSMFYKQILKSLKGIKLFITYEKNSEQIKARNFEIPMSYGFQISNYAISIEDYFNVGKEIVVFNSKEELLKLCQYYLNNETNRKNILHNSYIRSAEHTYVNRFKLIFEKLNKL